MANSNKTAQRSNPHLDSFKAVVESRRSVKRFTDTPIPEEVLQDCLDMALLAPNSSNLQPWEFVVIKTPEIKEKAIKACLNQNAAKTSQAFIAIIARTDTWQEHAADVIKHWPTDPVPHIVKRYYTSLTKANFSLGPMNTLAPIKWAGVKMSRLTKGATSDAHYSRGTIKLWATKSTALAAQNLMLAFRAHGFDSCPMEGFDNEAMSKLLRLNKHQSIVMMLGAGERAENGIYHPQFRFERERFIKEV